MADANGTAPAAGMEQHVPQAALDAVDLTVPGAYETEIMAGEMVDHLTAYHKVAAAVRAARQAENHQRAEQLAKEMLFLRNCIALVQHQHPDAKAIADQIMRHQAQRVARAREAAGQA